MQTAAAIVGGASLEKQRRQASCKELNRPPSRILGHAKRQRFWLRNEIDSIDRADSKAALASAAW